MIVIIQIICLVASWYYLIITISNPELPLLILLHTYHYFKSLFLQVEFRVDFVST